MKRGDIKTNFNKAGQVTVFIIIGVLIVVAIVLFFIFQNDLNLSSRLATNPTQFIEDCAQQNINPILENIVYSGGVYYNGLNNNSFERFENQTFAILCTTNLSNSPCINTHPLLLDEIKTSISQALYTKIDSCFKQYQKKYPSAEITEGKLDFEVDFVTDSALIKIRKPITLTSGEESNSFNNFDLVLNSKLYNFAELASIIVNAESSCNCNGITFTANNSGGQVVYVQNTVTTNPFFASMPSSNCNVDLVKLNNEYPDYIFTRKTLPNGEKVYTISTVAEPVQNFSFVVKNCINLCGGPGEVCYHHYHDGDVVVYDHTLHTCHNNIHHYHDETWEYRVV